MYGLQTAWFNTSSRRRLDGFQARCLRRICGILPSFMSRVSNATVLQQAGAAKASSTLLARQLALFGRIALLEDSSPLRQALFQSGSLNLIQAQKPRRRGRPRQSWPGMVREHAVQAANGEAGLTAVLASKCRTRTSQWRRVVSQYCANV